jgi:glycine dehydrogenase subunit 1
LRYIPASDSDIRKMMQDIGISKIEELFASIPQKFHFNDRFSFPQNLSEQELAEHLWKLSNKNQNLMEFSSFLGGGAYYHYTPALVDALISRGEFMTSYTPYQPEISQGTLQAIFEFQSLICEITGLDIANASMYDGASSAAEAVLMARRLKSNRNKILISSTVHPNYRQVIRTYVSNLPVSVVELPFQENGRTDEAALQKELDDQTICLVTQSPNYFGVIEDQESLFASTKAAGALSICLITEALSLGILKSPGQCGADIAAGETQSLGLPLSYGGPYAGFLAAQQVYMRALPGRLVGMAKDTQGRRGFVLTLAAREQHIRREKATSNICTNQGLCALAVTIYLSFLGAEGFRKLAVRNLQMAAYAQQALQKVASLPFHAPVFNEFVVNTKMDAEEAMNRLKSKGIFAGIPLSRYYPSLRNSLLVCATEMTKKEEIDRLARELKGLS